MRDGGIVKPSIETIPHPRCGSPLCTRGPCIRIPTNQNLLVLSFGVVSFLLDFMHVDVV